jgi:hypothetical protein
MIESGLVALTGCTFEGNSAPHAGAIKVYVPAWLQMTDCILSGNSAATDGGALYDVGLTTDIERCVFDGNTANRGGAVYLSRSGDYRMMQHCVFRHNTAQTDGGAFFLSAADASIEVQNCTLAENVAGLHGGGIYGMGGTPYLVNTIIAYNGGEGDYCTAVDGYHVRYSLLFGNTLGSYFANPPLDTLGRLTRINSNGDSCDYFYNLYADPLFVDTASGNYHLMANSPCIDAGDPTTPHDPDGTIADIGAFYYNQLGARDHLTSHPSVFVLSAFPNPFNSTLRISFSLPHAENVKVTVYDITGRLVAALIHGNLDAGEHEIAFDGKSLASGIYFVRLKSVDVSQTWKIVLIR